MTNREIYDIACALFDGGWRKNDAEDIAKEYDMTIEEAERVCRDLDEIEENNKLTAALKEVSEERNADYYLARAEEMLNGKNIEVPASLMDDDIREHLHEMMAPCKDVTFVAAYLAHHWFKFEEDFVVV